jgi:hypothetical protein
MRRRKLTRLAPQDTKGVKRFCVFRNRVHAACDYAFKDMDLGQLVEFPQQLNCTDMVRSSIGTEIMEELGLEVFI